jgi:hypothetical protein
MLGSDLVEFHQTDHHVCYFVGFPNNKYLKLPLGDPNPQGCIFSLFDTLLFLLFFPLQAKLNHPKLCFKVVP